MPDLGRFRAADYLSLLLTLIIAAGSRAWYVNACADGGRSDGPVQVQGSPGGELDALAASLSTDRGYGVPAAPDAEPSPRAHPAPLYPWLLSLLLRVTPDAAAMHHAARWLQVGLGALTAACLFLFARWAFHSPIVAVVAGLFGALYPFWVVNTAEIADGVLATFLLSLSLYLGARAGQVGGFLTSWCYGLALAGLALTRAALLPFSFLAVLAFLVRCRRLERGWMPAVLGFLGFVSGLAPWAVRNYQAFHDVYPVVDTAVFHLWEGNHPNATGGPLSDVTPEQPPLSDRERAEQILDELRTNPAGTWQRRLWAGLYFFFGEDWFKKGALWRATTAEGDGLGQTYPAVLSGSLLAMLLLGVLGWRWTFPWRSEAMPSALAVIWVPLPYLLGHAEALQGPRLPLDAVFLAYAAYALTWLVLSFGALFKGRLGVEVERR